MKSNKALFRAVPVRVKPVTAAVATALGTLAGATVSMAASQPDELVVSATRRDTSLQQVPYSMSALGQDTLEQLQINDLSGIARWSPGLIQVDQGARNANLLIFRGINSSAVNSPEFLNNSNDRVATYYGETPVYINLNTIDIERIEVLRGPQGTVYGARSLAGALRYIPAQPDTQEFTTDAHVRSYSTDESTALSYEGDVVFNIPLVEDTLALRALLGYTLQRGFIDYKYLVPEPGVSCPEPGFSDPECSSDGFNQDEDANSVRTRSYGLALRWEALDKVSATLSWRQQNRDIGGRNINSSDALKLIETNRGIDIDAGKYVSGLRFTEPSSRVNNIGNLNIVWDTDIGQLTSSTSYTTYKENGRRDQTDLLLDLEPDDYYYYEEFPAFTAFTNDVLDDEIFTQEVRLVSNDADSRWNWLAGAFYQDADLFSRSQEFTPGYAAWDPFFTTANGDLEYDNKTFQKDREFAVFGELGFDVTDKLNLLAGARWFDFEQKFRSCTAFPIATTGFGGSPDVDDPSNCTPMTGFAKADDNDILGKLSATYTFTEDLNVYALFSEGYAPGGVNGRVDLPSERLVKPERTRNYEVGIKSNWLDNRLTVNGALFFIDWQDIQVAGSTALGNFRIVRNGEEAESRGLELDASFQVNDKWNLAAGYSYTNAELTKGCTASDLLDPTKACALPDEPTASGDRLPGAPEHQGFVRTTYTTQLTSELDARLNYGITAQSDVFTKLGNGSNCCRDNGDKLSGFALHFASASLVSDKWEATLFIENVLNKYAETGVREDRTTLRTAGPAPEFTLRRYFKNVVRPRNVGIDFRYRFK